MTGAPLLYGAVRSTSTYDRRMARDATLHTGTVSGERLSTIATSTKKTFAILFNINVYLWTV